MQDLIAALEGVEIGATLRVTTARGMDRYEYQGVSADALVLTANHQAHRVALDEVREIAVREGPIRGYAAIGALICGPPLSLYIGRDRGTPEVQGLVTAAAFVVLVVGALFGAGLGALIGGLTRTWRVVWTRE